MLGYIYLVHFSAYQISLFYAILSKKLDTLMHMVYSCIFFMLYGDQLR